MSRDRSEEALGLMNAAVGLVVLIPVLLIASDAMPRSVADRKKSAATLSAARDIRLTPGVDQPPIITISEGQIFSFPSGTAELTPEFQRFLSSTIVSKLASLAARYGCDVIEVIGHTDSQPVRTNSNLDAAFLYSLEEPTRTLIPGSNPDLGLMRAWAVISFLRADHRLSGKTFYGYSAGEAILPLGELARPVQQPADEPSRRRIEIRIRKSV